MAKEKKLALDEFEIEKKKYKLKPVKMKDIKNGFYDDFLILSNFGFVRALSYEDGEEILMNFLRAVCANEKDVDAIVDDLTAQSMAEILTKVKQMNEIHEIDDLIRQKN